MYTLPNWMPSGDISVLILNVVDFFISNIAIPFAVFMIILSGFRFTTAQGNEEKLKKARGGFMWTVIGVAVVLAARTIVNYVRELFGNSSGNTLNAFINQIRATLNTLIKMLFALVTVYFIWGVIQYVRAGGDEEKLRQGKRHMIWGIIGMAIMGAAWGIVNILKKYIGA